MFSVVFVISTLAQSTGMEHQTEELKRTLIGAWIAIEGEQNGKRTAFRPDGPIQIRITFTKKDVAINAWVFSGRSTYTIHANPNEPHEIMLKSEDGVERHGIFSVKGGDLKICVDNSGVRPVSFATKQDDGCTSFTFRRK